MNNQLQVFHITAAVFTAVIATLVGGSLGVQLGLLFGSSFATIIFLYMHYPHAIREVLNLMMEVFNRAPKLAICMIILANIIALLLSSLLYSWLQTIPYPEAFASITGYIAYAYLSHLTERYLI